MLKIKNKNNYETKVTTIDGYCGVVYEENLKQYKKDLAKVLEQLKLAKRPNRIKNLKRRAATL